MRIPCLETKRLILRSFTEDDTDALYLLLSDQEVNTFLPWFPVKDKAEANQFYKERLAASNKAEPPYSYAICFKEDPRPIGYVTVGMDDSYDFGYALRKEFWHKGLVTKASRAVVAQLMKYGLPKREGRFPFFKIPPSSAEKGLCRFILSPRIKGVVK